MPPSRAVWSFSTWISTSSTPSARQCWTIAATATFEASRTRVNIDSAPNIAPNATPYRPPASSPSCHTSKLCAHPSRCSAQYPSTTCGVIHVPSRRSAHARMTASNAASTVTRNLPCRRVRPSRCGTVNVATGSTARGSGEHQTTSSSGLLGHGKNPAAYAASTVAGARSPPSTYALWPGRSTAAPGKAYRDTPVGSGGPAVNTSTGIGHGRPRESRTAASVGTGTGRPGPGSISRPPAARR